MTAASATATCQARVPAHLSDAGWRCNSPHFADHHVCQLPGGVGPHEHGAAGELAHVVVGEVLGVAAPADVGQVRRDAGLAGGGDGCGGHQAPPRSRYVFGNCTMLIRDRLIRERPPAAWTLT